MKHSLEAEGDAPTTSREALSDLRVDSGHPRIGSRGTVDPSNCILAGTNNYIAEIGGRRPMTVEEFVKSNREAFV